MKKQLLASVLLTITATIASAADWIPLALSDESTLYVASDKVVRTGDTVAFWDKTVYSKSKKVGPYTVAYTVSKDELSCTEGKFRSLSSSIYSSAGEAVHTLGPTEWSDIPPDTMMDKVAAKLCSSS
ncbi:surface-adhesin E family protein [Paraburkholderia dipogonis]|uniref:surface-adhesin E family protein n=1 Tax=Paraburkholderia dipogonis TaxID=1211383 RepID=UPI0038BB823A